MKLDDKYWRKLRVSNLFSILPPAFDSLASDGSSHHMVIARHIKKKTIHLKMCENTQGIISLGSTAVCLVINSKQKRF